MESQNIILYYKGPFDEDVLAKIGGSLRLRFPEAQKAGKKIFAIFLEIAQNIFYYSAEKNHISDNDDKSTNGVGTVAIFERDDSYTFTSGNLVSNEILGEILERVEAINRLDQKGLRELKKKYRARAINENKSGGNIGIIQVAIKSEQPIHVEVEKVSDKYSYFILSTDIMKI